MLSATDLLTITTKPSEQDVSLQIIHQFYKEHLCGRVFTFELDDAVRPIVKLRFLERHLCHLLGIQYVVKNLKNKYDYSGEDGAKKLEDGTLSFDFLKTTNKAWYKSKQRRMLYFPFVYQIVNNPTVIVFSTNGLNTMLDVDIILYNHVNNTYLHLGLDKDPDSDYYYPKSFYDRKQDDHIVGRTVLPIKKISIEIDK
jgi:hypothetical protein